MRTRRLATLAAALLAAAAGLAVAAPDAAATTGTCTNIATPISPPVGCGGIYLPLDGTGIQPNGTSLTLTAAADYWNAGITVTPYNPSDASQDFTAYQVCTAVAGPRTALAPCGTGGTPATDPLSGFGEYVAEITPLGGHLGGALNTIGNLCLSLEAVRDGPPPRHAIRWHAVERTCDTNGAVFSAGFPDGGHGVPGIVTSPNLWQTWSPVPGPGGYVLANDQLSGHYFTNRPFVLDKRGAGLAPGPVIAFPENDQANQVWKVIGCTSPVTELTPGFYNCP